MSKSSAGEASSAAVPARGDTRTRLLREAEWIIVHEGVHALTIRHLGARAGTNSALIGYHFGSVGGLLGELAQLNGRPIIAEQTAGFRRVAAAGATLATLLDAFLRPLWRGAALNPSERALVVVDEIVSHAEMTLRQEVWRWFSEGAAPFNESFARLLPALPPETVRWRLRFLSAAALDLPPRDARTALAPVADSFDEPGEDERYRQFLSFAKGALAAPTD